MAVKFITEHKCIEAGMANVDQLTSLDKPIKTTCIKASHETIRNFFLKGGLFHLVSTTV
jgi:hypothetical protein